MRKPIFTLLAFCFLSILATPLQAAQTQAEASPVTLHYPKEVGDGTAFPVTVRGEGLESMTLSFLNRSITAKPDKTASSYPEIVLLLPVPLDHESGPATLTWSAKYANGSAGGGSATITITKRKYPVQELTVAPQYVTPDPALKERLDRERAQMGAALNTRSSVRHWDLPMARPVPGKITSLYGLRRVLNGKPRSAHKGLDFRGAESSPIKAIADGTVVLTGDFYYAGQFVILDHGLGVVSISMHMSEIIATRGQTVKTGDVIGLVGSTGRSTGPHLHLGISVLGQSIDALPLIAQTEEDKAAYAAAMQKASEVPRKKSVKKTGESGKKKKNSAKPIKKTAKQPIKQ